jgi:hypothetical protein
MKYLHLISLIAFNCYARSPIRYPDLSLPEVTTHWQHSPHEYYTHRHTHYCQYPLFAFSMTDLEEDILPLTRIKYPNNNTQHVDGSLLSALIDEVIPEIQKLNIDLKKNNKLNHFTILQDKNFSYKKSCGLMVLKFKNYPFVLKIFMEKPETISSPYATGFEPLFFFYMGGGANRHLSGLTRIKTLKIIKKQIALMPRWATHVEFPRKWFWVPHNSKNIVIKGKNISDTPLETTLPSIYAIVADAIETDKEIPIDLKRKKRMVMQLCNDLHVYIDPHFNNYFFLQDKNLNKFKIVIVDTEHFPTMVGLKHKKHFRNHHSWYMYLASKCAHDMFFQTKYDLKKARTQISELAIKNPIFEREPYTEYNRPHLNRKG